jgi:hypothetical protein
MLASLIVVQLRDAEDVHLYIADRDPEAGTPEAEQQQRKSHPGHSQRIRMLSAVLVI